MYGNNGNKHTLMPITLAILTLPYTDNCCVKVCKNISDYKSSIKFFKHIRSLLNTYTHGSISNSSTYGKKIPKLWGYQKTVLKSEKLFTLFFVNKILLFVRGLVEKFENSFFQKNNFFHHICHFCHFCHFVSNR